VDGEVLAVDRHLFAVGPLRDLDRVTVHRRVDCSLDRLTGPDVQDCHSSPPISGEGTLRRLNYTGVFAPSLRQRAGNPTVALTPGLQPFAFQLVPMVLK
jgi:hypothetical protein